MRVQLAGILAAQGDHGASSAEFATALDSSAQLLGRDHPTTLAAVLERGPRQPDIELPLLLGVAALTLFALLLYSVYERLSWDCHHFLYLVSVVPRVGWLVSDLGEITR